MKFLSKKKTIWSATIALIIAFYAFNFVPRNINIIATRSALMQIFDYCLNFVIFFVVAYLVLTLLTFFVMLFSSKK